MVEYEVYESFWVRPVDSHVFEQNDGTTRQVTLVTCNASGSQRLVVRLREK